MLVSRSQNFQFSYCVFKFSKFCDLEYIKTSLHFLSKIACFDLYMKQSWLHDLLAPCKERFVVLKSAHGRGYTYILTAGINVYVRSVSR